jgi:uncharacterized protein
MEIKIAAIPPEGLTLHLEREAAEFPELRAMVRRGELAFTAPVKARVRIAPGEGFFDVHGDLESVVEVHCSRCLVSLRVPLASSFEVTFALALPGDGTPPHEEPLELQADDMGLDWIHGDTLDLRATLQEQVLLALPMQVLCRPDCRGLCSRCGQPLDAGGCACPPEAPDPRWAALHRLKLKS